MPEKPLVVLDTTVLVSAFLTSKGVAGRVLTCARNDYVLVLSRDILAETLEKLLTKEKIRKAYRYSDLEARKYVDSLTQVVGVMVNDTVSIAGVVRDPDDDMIIACAATASADLIVTRDKDLLTLGSFESTRIVTPRELLNAIAPK
jgi:putative PIN family toxin of toxin-antitoxin system